MTNPNHSDTDPSDPPPTSHPPGLPRSQIGVLTLNFGILLMVLHDFLPITGIGVSESLKNLAAILFFTGLGIYGFALLPWQGLSFDRQPTDRSPWMSRLNWGIFGTVILLTLLTLILPAVRSARRAAEEREKRTEAVVKGEGSETIVSTKSGDIVEIPGNWEEHTDPAARGNEVSRIDVANDLLFYLRTVRKEDVTYANLEAWADETLKQTRGMFESSEVLERTTYAAPGPPTIELVLEFTTENTRLVSLMRFIEAPDHYIWAWTLATRSRFRAHEDTLRRIVRSVRSE